MIAAIVSADDFGLAPAINEGILLAHAKGCLTSASLCVVGPAAAAAARASRDFPGLGIGLHLTLVAERPAAPPTEIPSLVGPDGRFPSTAFAFARRWLAGRIRREELRREVRAQLERARDLGVSPTHLDSHQHVHVLPGVLELVLEEMRRAGIARLRVPLETARVSPAGWKRRALRCGLNPLARRAARVARRAGIEYPRRFLGFLGAGRTDVSSLLAAIESLEPGVNEIALHPAVGPGLPREDFAAWGYRWDVELAALLDPRIREAFDRRGIVRLHFGGLPVRPP